MLHNYFITAFRNLWKYKFYSLINIVGLTLGVVSCIFIALYVYDELSYDRFHEKAERIYRVTEFIDTEGSGERSSSVPFPTGPTLAEEYETHIETQVRFFDFQSPTLFISERELEREFNEPDVLFVDSTFFDVFDYELAAGDKATALQKPNSVLLTRDAAMRYFGDDDPMGRILQIEGKEDLIVTGVLSTPPTHAHFKFDFLVSFSTLRNFFNGQYPSTWYWNPCWTYVLLKPNVQPKDVEKFFPEFIVKYFPEFIQKETRLELQPLVDIHLKSDLAFELEPTGGEGNIYVFTAIGVFILFIACMNFMNLSTARSLKRAREVGLRKTLGSKRRQLVLQFLIESLMIALIAIVAALVLSVAGLHFFNGLAEKSMDPTVFLNPWILLALVLIFLVAGVGSGLYPAFVLSSFIPSKSLKAQGKGGRGGLIRKVLVVVQFALSIMMIISTVLANRQLDFLRRSDAGFDSSQILYIAALRTPITKTYPAFKKELEQREDVVSVTGVLDVLGSRHQGDNYRFEGMEKSKLFSVMWVNHDFFKTFGLELAAGRPFLENMTTDDSLALIVNEAFVKQMGWTAEEAIGKGFEYVPYHGKIIGVVKDFNFVSKHRKIEPLILQLRSNPGHFNFSLKYVAVKLNSTDMAGTVAAIEAKWKMLAPGRPFDYFFLDQELDQLYKAEEKLGRVAGLFSGLAIVVACLGLFALASFMAEERRKEIGVRKVMGSSVRQVVVLLTKDFTRLIVVAFTVACPLTWYLMDRWLNQFAFHIEMDWLTFLLAGLATTVVALLTISYRAVQAASENPINALRYE